MKIKQIEVSGVHATDNVRARVLIIYTGGTFGMTHDKSGALIPFDFSSIVEHLPTIKNLGLAFSVFTFETPIDSSNIRPEHWEVIGKIIFDNYSSHDGFVVLHGTDTMAYTASALSFMLQGLNKPVVLTGAQLPIIDPRSDARENLITALEIAAAKLNGQAIVPEVCIYFDYELLRGNRSKKVESMQFDAFDSGNYPPLAKAGVKIDYNQAAIRKPDNKPVSLLTNFNTNIAILKLFPGIREPVVRAVLDTGGLKAVILETYGSGNAPTSPWLIELLAKAINSDIIIVNVSQCPGGMVVQGKYETSKELKRIGVLSGADMTTEAALTKLMVLLGQYSVEACREMIEQDIAGELTT
ncbi:MAG TPA: asparaginase [Cyclobacteriaceae bacterium]|nr:asparaginase [Cyclobacteriaceae bacterium]HRJ83362.1 asparaginase [Cyclobacteriaceae bacterium]